MFAPFDPDNRHRWDATLQAWLGPLAEVMLTLARVNPGNHALDIAPGVLTGADRDGHSRCRSGVLIESMDGEPRSLPDRSCDAVLSRTGLLSPTDWPRMLAEAHRVLRPGGHIAVAAYDAPERNAFLAIPLGIVRRAASPPPHVPGQSGPFDLAEPGALAGALHEAGFTDITVRVVHAPLRLPSAAACARFARDLLIALRHPLAELPTGEHEAIWEEVGLMLRQFESNRVFVAPCALLVGVGTK